MYRAYGMMRRGVLSGRHGLAQYYAFECDLGVAIRVLLSNKSALSR
jgi:hypothetical protein